MSHDDDTYEIEDTPTVDDSVRFLFPEGERSEIDRRLEALRSDDPARWEEIDFAIEVAIELSSACNLRCIMCPVATTTRPARLMTSEIVRAAVDEIKDDRGLVLLPQGFGETMLHPDWHELVGYAVEQGIRPIVMLSNGTKLTEDNSRHLLRLEVDALVLSIDGTEAATYERIRVGARLEQVETNVRRLIELRGDQQRPRLFLRIIRMRETADQIEPFFERWQPLLGEGDEILVNEYNDWAGKVEDRRVDGAEPSSSGPGRRPPCRMLWRNLSVQSDGRVSACCHDSEAELIIGDLSQGETLREIWQGERLARLRRIHLEGRFDELPICDGCRNWY